MHWSVCPFLCGWPTPPTQNCLTQIWIPAACNNTYCNNKLCKLQYASQRYNWRQAKPDPNDFLSKRQPLLQNVCQEIFHSQWQFELLLPNYRTVIGETYVNANGIGYTESTSFIHGMSCLLKKWLGLVFLIAFLSLLNFYVLQCSCNFIFLNIVSSAQQFKSFKANIWEEGILRVTGINLPKSGNCQKFSVM